MEDRLHKFAQLVDAGSFTKAATTLHISQPALSTAIQKLERELGAELLVRSSRSFRLTEAGMLTYEAAKELTVHMRNLRQELHGLSNSKATVSLGMIDSIATLLFVQNDTLYTLQEQLRLSLTIDNSARLITQVEHDQLDVALIAKTASIPATLTYETVAKEPLVLVVHATQAKEVKDYLQKHQLHTFLSYNQHAQTHHLIMEYFQQHAIHVHPTFYSTSPEIMLHLVLQGKGAAVLPYLLTREYIKKGILIPLRVSDAMDAMIIGRSIMSIRRTGRRLAPQMYALLEQTKNRLETLHREAHQL